MGKSIESQWRDDGKAMRSFEKVVGKETLEQFGKLSPEARDLVLKALGELKAEAKKDPQALVEALRPLIGFYQGIQGGIEKVQESRPVYDTEQGARIPDAEIAQMIEHQVASAETELEKTSHKPASGTVH